MSSLLQVLQSKPFAAMVEYGAYISKTAKEIGIQEKINLRFQHNFSALCCSKKGIDGVTNRVIAVVKLNLSFLIDPRDVPEKFLVKSMEDPKIHDETFIRSFTAWVDSYFHTKCKKDLADNKKERNALILFLYRASKPELLEKSRKWEILHEMAHLSLPHHSIVKKMNDSALSSLLKYSALSATAAVTGTYFLTVLIPSLSYLSAFVFGAGTFAGTLYCADKMKTREYCLKCRTLELEADAFAVTALRDKSGAKHHLKTLIDWREKVIPERERILQDSRPIEYRVHPTLQDRLTRIEKMTF